MADQEPSAIDWDQLIRIAVEVRQRAYAPYSRFLVGAAVLTRSGEVFAGCNVENASYGLALCAERNAISRAVAEGHRDLVAVAVAATPLATPCGACRQFIAEFGLGIEVGSVDAEAPGLLRRWSIAGLLPESFRF